MQMIHNKETCIKQFEWVKSSHKIHSKSGCFHGQTHRKRDSFSVRLAQLEQGGWKRLNITTSLVNCHRIRTYSHHIRPDNKCYIDNLHVHVRKNVGIGGNSICFLS